MIRELKPHQLEWCRKKIPSFAPAEADVLRRDAEVAANRAYFRPYPVVPPENLRLDGEASRAKALLRDARKTMQLQRDPLSGAMLPRLAASASES